MWALYLELALSVLLCSRPCHCPPGLPSSHLPCQANSTKPWQRNLLLLWLTCWKQQKGMLQNFKSELTGTMSAWKTEVPTKLIRTQTSSLFLEQGSWVCQSFPETQLMCLASQSCPNDWGGTHQPHLDDCEMNVQCCCYWTDIRGFKSLL